MANKTNAKINRMIVHYVMKEEMNINERKG